MRARQILLFSFSLLFLALPSFGSGFDCQDNPIVPGDDDIRWDPGPNGPDLPPNCAPGDRCYPPKSGPEPPYITTNPPGCDATAGPCVPEYRLPLEFPGQHQNTGHPEHAMAWVFPGWGGKSGCPNVGSCGHEAQCGGTGGGGSITNSSGELVIPGGPVTCPDTEHDRRIPHDVVPVSCNTCCRDHLSAGGADFSKEAVAAALGCSSPPKGGCNDGPCETCGEGGTPLGGGGPSWGGDGATGPGATFRYTAGGVRAMGWPGSRRTCT
jgi:hypothetical protein